MSVLQNRLACTNTHEPWGWGAIRTVVPRGNERREREEGKKGARKRERKREDPYMEEKYKREGERKVEKEEPCMERGEGRERRETDTERPADMSHRDRQLLHMVLCPQQSKAASGPHFFLPISGTSKDQANVCVLRNEH